MIRRSVYTFIFLNESLILHMPTLLCAADILIHRSLTLGGCQFQHILHASYESGKVFCNTTVSIQKAGHFLPSSASILSQLPPRLCSASNLKKGWKWSASAEDPAFKTQEVEKRVRCAGVWGRFFFAWTKILCTTLYTLMFSTILHMWSSDKYRAAQHGIMGTQILYAGGGAARSYLSVKMECDWR